MFKTLSQRVAKFTNDERIILPVIALTCNAITLIVIELMVVLGNKANSTSPMTKDQWFMVFFLLLAVIVSTKINLDLIKSALAKKDDS